MQAGIHDLIKRIFLWETNTTPTINRKVMNNEKDLLANITRRRSGVDDRCTAAAGSAAQRQGGRSAMGGVLPELQAILGESGIHQLGAAAALPAPSVAPSGSGQVFTGTTPQAGETTTSATARRNQQSAAAALLATLQTAPLYGRTYSQ